MVRSIVGVVVGFLVWTILWLGSNAGLARALPEKFSEDGTTESSGILLLIVVLSLVFSVLSGLVTKVTTRTEGWKPVGILGGLLLLVGIVVQLQYWDVMPVWYHLCFLVLLLPGVLLGGRLAPSRAVSQ